VVGSVSCEAASPRAGFLARATGPAGFYSSADSSAASRAQAEGDSRSSSALGRYPQSTAMVARLCAQVVRAQRNGDISRYVRLRHQLPADLRTRY
jgi:hypothetical protein